ERSAVLPDVPTMTEAVPGLQDFEAHAWQAIMAPKNTPPAVLTKVNQALNTALRDPDVLSSLKFQGAEVMSTSPQECQAFIDGESERWLTLIKKLGLRN